MRGIKIGEDALVDSNGSLCKLVIDTNMQQFKYVEDNIGNFLSSNDHGIDQFFIMGSPNDECVKKYRVNFLDQFIEVDQLKCAVNFGNLIKAKEYCVGYTSLDDIDEGLMQVVLRVYASLAFYREINRKGYLTCDALRLIYFRFLVNSEQEFVFSLIHMKNVQELCDAVLKVKNYGKLCIMIKVMKLLEISLSSMSLSTGECIEKDHNQKRFRQFVVTLQMISRNALYNKNLVECVMKSLTLFTLDIISYMKTILMCEEILAFEPSQVDMIEEVLLFFFPLKTISVLNWMLLYRLAELFKNELAKDRKLKFLLMTDTVICSENINVVKEKFRDISKKMLLHYGKCKKIICVVRSIMRASSRLFSYMFFRYIKSGFKEMKMLFDVTGDEIVKAYNVQGKDMGLVSRRLVRFPEKTGLYESAGHVIIWRYLNGYIQLGLGIRPIYIPHFCGAYDFSVSGNSNSYESFQQTAERKISEELGIKLNVRNGFICTPQMGFNSMSMVYLVYYEGKGAKLAELLEQGYQLYWVTFNTLEHLVNRGDRFKPDFLLFCKMMLRIEKDKTIGTRHYDNITDYWDHFIVMMDDRCSVKYITPLNSFYFI